jgi:hypothetical protein
MSVVAATKGGPLSPNFLRLSVRSPPLAFRVGLSCCSALISALFVPPLGSAKKCPNSKGRTECIPGLTFGQTVRPGERGLPELPVPSFLRHSLLPNPITLSTKTSHAILSLPASRTAPGSENLLLTDKRSVYGRFKRLGLRPSVPAPSASLFFFALCSCISSHIKINRAHVH